MNRRIPITVAKDLTLAIGGTTTRLTPSTGFRLAEKLIRASTRAMIHEEAQAPQLRVPTRKLGVR